ncbi:heat-shock protein [Bacteroidota bacterium]|nr:heat-shock protein [Bacteroidota bacterium]
MTLIKFKNDRLQTPSFFNTIMDDFFNADFPVMPRSSTQVPPVNVKETPEAFHLELAVPGLYKDQVDINLDGNLLTISGKHEEKSNQEKESYTRREFSYNSFSRTFTLPENVNAELIHADLNDGILKVNLPKKEEAKQKGPKSIKVS